MIIRVQVRRGFPGREVRSGLGFVGDEIIS